MGISPLAIAIYEGHTAVALLLLHRGADVNLEDEVMKGTVIITTIITILSYMQF